MPVPRGFFRRFPTPCAFSPAGRRSWGHPLAQRRPVAADCRCVAAAFYSSFPSACRAFGGRFSADFPPLFFFPQAHADIFPARPRQHPGNGPAIPRRTSAIPRRVAEGPAASCRTCVFCGALPSFLRGLRRPCRTAEKDALFQKNTYLASARYRARRRARSLSLISGAGSSSALAQISSAVHTSRSQRDQGSSHGPRSASRSPRASARSSLRRSFCAARRQASQQYTRL